jgi:hypothetical protein
MTSEIKDKNVTRLGRQLGALSEVPVAPESTWVNMDLYLQLQKENRKTVLQRLIKLTNLS